MTPKQCTVCGETRFASWPHCPACGHPYPDADGTSDHDDADDDESDDEEDGDEEAGDE
jgi:hypothetical protein